MDTKDTASEGTRLICERVERVLVLTLNRPQVLNALDSSLIVLLDDALDRGDQDDDVSVVVVTGKGRAFCSGADLKEIARSGGGSETGDVGEVDVISLGRVTNRFISKPVIGAINGLALGGGMELALMCDLIVASPSAVFGLPEVRRGLVAGGGGLVRLPRQAPFRAALEMAFTGESISAQQALDWGLINRVVSDGASALDEALKLGAAIAANAPLAVRGSKRVVYEGLDAPLEAAATAWDRSDNVAREVRRSADAREGARAFAEGRTPSWKGR